MRRWIGALALCVAGFVFVGCGGDGGSTSVALPGSKNDLLDKYRAQLEGTGVPHQVAQCYEDKLRGLSDSEFRQFVAESATGKLTTDLTRLNLRLRRECIPAGSQVVDPNAPSDVIQRDRALLVQGATKVIRSQGASDAQVACITEKLNALPEPEIVKVSNSPSEARSVFRGMATQCGGS